MVFPLDFDQVNFRVSRVPVPPGLVTPDLKYGGTILNYHGVKDPYYSRVNEDLVIGSDKVRYINSYNLVTGATSRLFDVGSVAATNSRLYSFSTGAKDDTFAVAAGGTINDTDPLVVWHQFSTGRSLVLNTVTALGSPVHNVRMDASGRYVEIALIGGGGTPYVWDTSSGQVSAFAPNGVGHRVGGYGVFLNATAPLWHPDSSRNPCLALRWAGNLASVTYRCGAGWALPSFPPLDVHLNWANVSTSGANPVLVSSYWDDPSPDPFSPGASSSLNNELYAQSTDASGLVWRFGFLYAKGGHSSFVNQPICVMTRDARYAACSTNNYKTWPLSTDNVPRVDVIVFELPRN
jgi:hypothetical protein